MVMSKKLKIRIPDGYVNLDGVNRIRLRDHIRIPIENIWNLLLVVG
jgi:hypothetical protein